MTVLFFSTISALCWKIRKRNRGMEEKAQEDKQKIVAAEARLMKLQTKNRALVEENTQLRQILQQIQVTNVDIIKIQSMIKPDLKHVLP